MPLREFIKSLEATTASLDPTKATVVTGEWYEGELRGLIAKTPSGSYAEEHFTGLLNTYAKWPIGAHEGFDHFIIIIKI